MERAPGENGAWSVGKDEDAVPLLLAALLEEAAQGERPDDVPMGAGNDPWGREEGGTEP